MKSKLKALISLLRGAGSAAGVRIRAAMPTQMTVSMLLGIGSFGWGAWEWWGPGPAKVLVGLIFMLNAVGLGAARKAKG